MVKRRELRDKYLARDLSWLKFNKRVLKEASNKDNPLLERVRFLAIFMNNLDEFFMVRVANLKRRKASMFNQLDEFGLYPHELLEQINAETNNGIVNLYKVYDGLLAKEFLNENIKMADISQLKKEAKRFVNDYFHSMLYPIITPMGVDAGHPFPVLPTKTLAFAVSIKRKKEDFLAIIPIPKNVPRVIRVPSAKGEHLFVLVEEIIQDNLKAFFKGYHINESTLFRVIRDSELDVEEESTENLLKDIDREVKNRIIANVVHMEVADTCSEHLLAMLSEGLSFPTVEVVRIRGQFDLTYLFQLASLVEKPNLCYPSYKVRKLEYENIFDKIKEGDFILHVPFDSFDPTVDLIEEAARDENVLAIKMTLYRTNSDSAIISALKEAASNNKQVTILVEIKARFDEENNIRWAKELELMGCHVIYGIPGLKVHSKMTLIVRKEEGIIKRYVHLSTGNYNESTARVYTDIGYFTDNEDFARDISDVFNVVTGYSMAKSLNRVISAPDDLRGYVISLIEREIKFQKKNKSGAINIKLNALEDVQIIDKLYEASQAGVKINLMIRGICCLVPGVKGLSENIKVRSVVGRFLEHTRIIEFHNNASPRVFLSSADWMTRNMDRRIELLFEIYKDEIKAELRQVLEMYWKDDTKAWEMGPNALYKKVKSKGSKFNVQEYLIGQ